MRATITLGYRLHVESRFRVFPYDEEKLRKLGRAALANRNPGVILAERGGRLVGFAVVAMGEHFFSPAKTATVQLLYVVPEARGGRAALKLLHGLRSWAAKAGALDLHVNVTTAIAPAKADRLFRRLGFKQTGGNYVLEKL